MTNISSELLTILFNFGRYSTEIHHVVWRCRHVIGFVFEDLHEIIFLLSCTCLCLLRLHCCDELNLK